MKTLSNGVFEGERALFFARDLEIYDSIFQNGESPLKESEGVTLYTSQFKWKYPLWYSKNAKLFGCVLHTTARSGIWYTDGIEMTDCVIDAPKTFRRSANIYLNKCSLTNAAETMWGCKNVSLTDVSVVGDYFAMNCEGISASGLVISGNYAFDGAKNIEISNSRLISKDAFWNTENVIVRDSLIVGEYLGWNSKNVQLINCTIESNQGMCYMEGLKMVNCTLINTDLAFEYSDAEADIRSSVVSVKNPTSGRISAKSIGEIIIDENSRAKKPVEITVFGGKNEV